MRLFGGDRLGAVMDKLGLEEGEVISAGMVTKAIERAQKKVEAQNFAIRKHTLEYDDVMNVQRKWIYERRLAALERESIKDEVIELIEDVVDELLEEHCPASEHAENWPMAGLQQDLRKIFLFNLQVSREDLVEMTQDSLREKIKSAVMTFYTHKEKTYGDEMMRQLERYAVLSTIDRHWRDHLAEIDELRTGIGLRAYHGQMGKPIDIYKKEAFQMFELMIGVVDREIVNLVYKLQINIPEKSRSERREQAMVTTHADSTGMGFSTAAQSQEKAQAQSSNPMAAASQAGRQTQTVKRTQPKVGRNDPCPCGSGKKYKKCHGANA